MRTERAFYNLISNLVLQIVTAAVGFILPALFITYYGSEVNGMIGSIKQFVAYLSLVEAGVGTASIAALYKPLSNQHFLITDRILSATKTFYKRSGYIFLTFLIIISVVYPWLVRNEIEIKTAFFMVIIIGFGGLMEYFLIGKYRVLLTADQKNYVISLIQAAATTLNAIVSVILIVLGTEILIVQAVATLIYLSRYFFIRYYVSSNYKYVTFKSEPDFNAIEKRWSAFIHQIAGIVVFNSPVVIITIFCGLKDVSVYVVYSMVFSAVAMIVGVFSNGLLAGFGQIIAVNEQETLRKAYSNYEYIFYGALAWAYTCTALLIMPFIEVYSANFTDINYIRPDIAALFVIIGIANNIRIPPNTLVTAAGHFRETQYRAILEATINLAASLIFVQYWGIIGVLMGSVCSYAYRTLDFILYTSKYILKQSFFPTFKRLAINLVLTFMSSLPFVIWLNVKANNYLEWFSWAIVVSIIVFIIVVIGNALTDIEMFKTTVSRVKGLVVKKV
jgi:O-antigen/teichoic acid export membrane protein